VTLLYYILIFLFSIFLTNCANHNGYILKGGYHSNTEKLLKYFIDAKQLDPKDLNREYKKAQQAYLKNKNYINTIRLALLLILPDSDFENEHRAIDILEESIQSLPKKEESLRNFATLLIYIIDNHLKKEILYEITNKKIDDIIEEKRKQEILYNEIIKKLNDLIEERKRQDILYKKIHSELTEKEQIIEKLQKKIEELKAIEKSLNKRKNVKAPTT
jgi:type I site-specific restriction-modification system R (restriction) subunit